LETGRRPWPPQSASDLSSSRCGHRCPFALLPCGSPASRRHPSRLALHWFCAPASWFGSHRAVFDREARLPGLGRRDLPQASAPLRSVTRNPRRRQRRTHSPEVFCPHSAIHPSRSTIPERYLPGSRCVLALTMCLDAFLPRRAPWYPFNQTRPRGLALQSFPRQRSRPPLDGASPLAIGFRPLQQTLGLLFLRTSEIGRPKDVLFEQPV